MSLYKRGRTWHYDFSMAGERYRGSTKETALSRARIVEALLMAEAKERGKSSVPRRAPILSEFANRFLTWVDGSDLEPGSKRYYRYGWEMIQETQVAGMHLDKITTDETSELRLGHSPANANNALRTLRRMLGKAAEWGLIRTAPRITLMKEHGRSTLIDRATETKLLAVAEQPLKDVLFILLDTGMRPAEVFRMRWEHVSWNERMIFIPFGKTRNSRRFVPMSQRVLDALLCRVAGKTEGWVLPSSQSKTGHIVTVEKQFLTARKKAGINPSVVLYSARHSFATQTLAATGNLAAVMKAFGHSDARTTMIYQHPGIEEIRRAVDQKNLAGMSQFASQSKTVQ
ncbi:MAG: site-specific integrase [Acidobacteriia bacterium]|nr:site-specific integrase [Terriglobia bacterium]